MNLTKAVFSTLLSLLIVATTSSSMAQEVKQGTKLEATSFIPVQATVGELSDSELERALVSEIHRIADKAFAEIKAKDPHAKVTQLKKVERAAIHRLKETKKLVELARSLNPKIGISVVATEVVVTVLGFGLISTGQVIAGTVVLNFPSAPLLLSVMVAYEIQKIKWQIGRELKTSVRELENIRKEVIGYNTKHKITTLILQDGDVQRELELVTKPIKNGSQVSEMITLNEVEKIVSRTADGESFLAHAYHQRGNKEVYASLLLQYLNDSPETLAILLEVLSQQRSKVTVSQKSSELRSHLMELSDIQKHIDRELKGARKEISATKKKVKRSEISKAEGAEIRAHLKSELLRLSEVRIQSFRHQYSLLLSAKVAYQKANDSEIAKLVRENNAALAELKVIGSFARIRTAAQASQVIRTCEQVFAVAY